jgi:hypothetical protein
MAVTTAAAITAGTIAGLGSAAIDRRENRKAVKQAEQQRQASLEFIEKQMKQSRGDLFKLFPASQESMRQGIGASMDVYRQSVPYQAQAFQEGNIAAQNQIIGGLPQMNNAILGGPVDYSQFQPTRLQGIGGMTMPQAPQFAPIQDIPQGVTS